MKFTSPHRDPNMYQEGLVVGAEQIGNIHQTAGRFLLNNVGASPLKITGLQDLASGQANIGTPARGRLDSHDSRMGVHYPLYKVNDHGSIGQKLLEHKF